MAINKVVYGTTVLVDLTNDTVRPESMLLGTRAHACNGDIIEGTLNRSQTGILVQIEGVTPAYINAKSVAIDLSEFTSIYQQITGEQIIVEFTHLDLYAPGLVFGGSIDTDITLSYEASTGIITLSTTESIFQSSNKCVANVYITEWQQKWLRVVRRLCRLVLFQGIRQGRRSAHPVSDRPLRCRLHLQHAVLPPAGSL